MYTGHANPRSLACLVLLGCCLQGKAEPGYGSPLSITTGTVYSVSTVASLKNSLNAANAAGVPATILIDDGTYDLDGDTLHITCPGLIVRSASGNREAVVVRGPDEGPSASNGNIFLLSADHVTLADMTFGYCRWHGVQIRGESPFDVSGTRIHNCRILNCNEQFIKGSSGSDPEGVSDGIIESCWFEFTGGWAYQYYTGGVDIHKGVNWIVRDNVFRSIRNPTWQPNIAEHAVHFWKRCTTRPQNIVVERNWIINCDRGIGFGLGDFDNGHNGGGSVIRNNFVVNDGSGGHTDVGIGLESARDVTVDNNTVYIPAYWAPMEYRFNASSNVVFRNNLMNSAIQNRDRAPAAQFWNNAQNAQAGWFADVASGDLRLTVDASSAIDQGSAIDAFADDIDGGARPVMGGWDIGAHEIDGDIDGDQLGDYWEMAYFGDTSTSKGMSHEDADADRFRDRWEYVAGTDPTDANSSLHVMQSVEEGGIRLQWTGVPGRTYSVHRTASLAAPFLEIAIGLPAQEVNAYLDAGSHATIFYQVGVEWGGQPLP